jgi:hypothetical protein
VTAVTRGGNNVGIDLSARVTDDGRLDLHWLSSQVLDSVHVLLVRTGAVPSQRAYPHVIKLLNLAGGRRDSFASVT